MPPKKGNARRSSSSNNGGSRSNDYNGGGRSGNYNGGGNNYQAQSGFGGGNSWRARNVRIDDKAEYDLLEWSSQNSGRVQQLMQQEENEREMKRHAETCQMVAMAVQSSLSAAGVGGQSYMPNAQQMGQVFPATPQASASQQFPVSNLNAAFSAANPTGKISPVMTPPWMATPMATPQPAGPFVFGTQTPQVQVPQPQMHTAPIGAQAPMGMSPLHQQMFLQQQQLLQQALAQAQSTNSPGSPLSHRQKRNRQDSEPTSSGAGSGSNSVDTSDVDKLWALVGEVEIVEEEKQDDAELNKTVKALAARFYDRHLIAATGNRRQFNLVSFNKETAAYGIAPLTPPNVGMPFRRAACEEWALKHVEANKNGQAKKK